MRLPWRPGRDDSPPAPSLRGAELINDPRTLDEGIRLLRVAVTDPTATAVHRLDLGVGLDRRFERDGQASDLDEAIGLYRAAATDPEVRTAGLINLCHALRMRFRVNRDPGDLDGAIAAGVDCVAQTPAGDERLPDRLEQLAHAYRERYEAGGIPSDLDNAIACYRRAAPPAGPLTGRSLVHAGNYALAVRARYEVDPGRGWLDEAIRAWALLADEPEAAAGTLHAAARLMLSRCGLVADLADLDRSAGFLERAIGLVSDPSDEVSLRVDLSVARRIRGQFLGRLEDVDAAIREARHALGVAPTEDDRSLAELALGNAHLVRHWLTGALSDVDNAIQSLRAAIRLEEADPIQLTMLGTALLGRHKLVHEPNDLDEAIAHSRRALAMLTPGRADSPGRSGRSGRAGSPGSPGRSGRSGSPGRADNAGSPGSADRPDSAGSPGRADRAGLASNAANALRMRYLYTGRPEDAEEAMAALQIAVEEAAQDSELAALATANLGILRLDRFAYTRQASDLTQAVELSRAALAALPGDSPHRPTQMLEVAAALREVYRFHHQPQALDEAIELALQGASTGRDRTLRYHAGTLLADRFRLTGDGRDIALAIGHLGAAAQAAEVATGLRVLAASRWGRLAHDTGDPVDALRAYSLGVAMLTSLSWRGSSRSARESMLAEVTDLGAGAAATALDLSRPDDAVALLEQGRAIMWSQQLELSGDLTGLYAANPELATRIDAVRQALRVDDLTLPRP